MADSGNHTIGSDCQTCVFYSELVFCVTGLVWLYAILLTICTCFLCRRLRWYQRHTGRSPPLDFAWRRIDARCPPPGRRPCTVELMCCCVGCKLAPVDEANSVPAPRSSSSAGGGVVGQGNGYERVVTHTVAKPEDYYIVPEGRNSGVFPRESEDSGASNIYEEVPDRRNFSRYPTPDRQTSSGLSGTYATVLHSGTTSQRVSVKSGLSSVSYSGATRTQGVPQQAPRLAAAQLKEREKDTAGSTMVDSEYQPLLSCDVQRTADYTDLHDQRCPTHADSFPVSFAAGSGVKLKEFAGGESTVDDEVPRVPRKYHTIGSTRETQHTSGQH